MEKTNKTLNANKIVKVERWIECYHGNSNWDGVEAEQLPDGRWLCEINLPNTDITVKAVCKTEANALIRATDKAYDVYKEFINSDMDTKRTIDSVRNMRMEVGENGEVISIGLSKKQREREGKKMMEMTNKSRKAIEAAIDKIGDIMGSTDNLVIEVMDKANFPKDIDDSRLIYLFRERISEQYDCLVNGSFAVKGNLIIFVGYAVRGEGE